MGEELEKTIETVLNGTTSKTGISIKLLAKMIDAKFSDHETERKRMHDEVMNAIDKLSRETSVKFDNLSVVSFLSTHKKLFLVIIFSLIILAGTGAQNIYFILSRLL
jgi:hypothetical protein